MPRSSPFAITLNSAEQAELHRRAAEYTLPYFQVQRAKMILYAAEGMANHEIADRLAWAQNYGLFPKGAGVTNASLPTPTICCSGRIIGVQSSVRRTDSWTSSSDSDRQRIGTKVLTCLAA